MNRYVLFTSVLLLWFTINYFYWQGYIMNLVLFCFIPTAYIIWFLLYFRIHTPTIDEVLEVERRVPDSRT